MMRNRVIGGVASQCRNGAGRCHKKGQLHHLLAWSVSRLQLQYAYDDTNTIQWARQRIATPISWVTGVCVHVVNMVYTAPDNRAPI